MAYLFGQGFHENRPLHPTADVYLRAVKAEDSLDHGATEQKAISKTSQETALSPLVRRQHISRKEGVVRE